MTPWPLWRWVAEFAAIPVLWLLSVVAILLIAEIRS